MPPSPSVVTRFCPLPVRPAVGTGFIGAAWPAPRRAHHLPVRALRAGDRADGPRRPPPRPVAGSAPPVAAHRHHRAAGAAYLGGVFSAIHQGLPAGSPRWWSGCSRSAPPSAPGCCWASACCHASGRGWCWALVAWAGGVEQGAWRSPVATACRPCSSRPCWRWPASPPAPFTRSASAPASTCAPGR